MSNKLMRLGASILAAAAVVAGGLTVGAGTSSASCDVPQGCDPNWHVSDSVENVLVKSEGPLQAALGGEVTYHHTFTPTATTPERYITEIVDHPPAGFVLEDVDVWFFGEDVTHYPELTPVVDPASGAVTISAAGEGWLLPWSSPGINVRIKYTVPSNATVGSVLKRGITFKASGFTGTQGWPVMEGTDTKIVAPSPAGSSAFGS